MVIKRTRRFDRNMKKLHRNIQNQVERTIALLSENWHHQSLRTHKMKSRKYGGCWNAWVNVNVRILFHLEGDSLVLLDVGQHDIVK
jgi:addiction module RelE/StbE family toxin